MTRPSSSQRERVELPTPPRMLHPGPGRQSRRQWTLGLLMLFAFTLVVIFGTSMAPRFVKPGNLSSSHAQILEGSLAPGDGISGNVSGNGCTMCHGNVSADSWEAMRASGHALSEGERLTMTDRCVACHHDRIPIEHARSAHNLPQESRVAIHETREAILLAALRGDESVRSVSNSGASFWLPSPAISQDAVACSVCHKEHHGGNADIKTIADARCQTCHQRQFESFADSHPEFTDWPVVFEHAIAFDHAKHANVHFPKTAETTFANGADSAAAFDCRACHDVRGGRASTSLADPIISTLPFAMACASCHDESLKVQIADGPSLIELPILPPGIASQIESWPDEATGAPDGKLSAWMLLLLRDQNPGTDFSVLADLSRVDWRSPENRELGVRLGRAIRQFAISLSLDGQAFLLDAARRGGADEATAKRLAGSFPTQLMSDAAVHWFGKPKEHVADGFAPRKRDSVASDGFTGGGSDLLGGDLLTGNSGSGDDDLLMDFSDSDDGGLLLPGDATEDPKLDLSHSSSADWEDDLKQRFDASRSQSLGGWYRDDLTLSIRYRGSGHEDVVLKSLIEMTSSVDRRLRDLVVTQPAVAACVSCHVRLPWRSGEPDGLRDRLTRFTHRPHLDITGLQDCQHCHTMPDEAERQPFEADLNRVSANPTPNRPHASDFLPLKKAACVSCHTPNAAGDHCTTCHRYHVGDSHFTQRTSE